MSDWLIVLIVIPFVIGSLGNIVKATVLGPKPWPPDGAGFNWFQRVYFRSLAWHPVFVAVPLWAAFVVFEWPGVFGHNVLAYFFAAGFSAAVTIIAYHLIVRSVRRAVSSVGGGGGDDPDGSAK